MKFQVTELDIEMGVPRNPETCPMAGAIWKAYPNANEIYVRNAEVVIFTGNEGYCFNLPAEAIDFINTFDEFGAHAVDPFAFEVLESDIKAVQPLIHAMSYRSWRVTEAKQNAPASALTPARAIKEEV